MSPLNQTDHILLFRKCGSFLVKVLLIGLVISLLSGCGIVTESPTVHDYLNLNWSQGTEWTVKYRIWPERKENPRTRKSREIIRTIRFRVGAPEESRKIINAIDLDNKNRYRLLFNNEFNLLEVNRVIDSGRASVVQLDRVLNNSLENTAMFRPGGRPSEVAPWFFPDLSVTMNQPRKRLSYGIRSNSAKKWMVQETETQSDDLILTINHEPERTRAIFRWRRGEPWWYRFRWYKSKRIVAEAKRVYRR